MNARFRPIHLRFLQSLKIKILNELTPKTRLYIVSRTITNEFCFMQKQKGWIGLLYLDN